jgi:glutamate synthase (NADPH/NADH) large chain/glutamate synthase (ferredoxin)
MTGGTVVVLGKTGRNFAAGMSGGVAYVYDEDGRFASRCNTSMVSLERVVPAAEQKATAPRTRLHAGQADEPLLKRLLEEHNRWTGSRRARELLDSWSESRGKFLKVFPNEYKRALAEMHDRDVAAASTGDNEALAMQREPAPAK